MPVRTSKEQRSAAPAWAWKIPSSLSVSKYLSSASARTKAQKEAKGTSSGPSGAEVDAHVASTLTRKDAAQILAIANSTNGITSKQDAIQQLQLAENRDAEGRVLGLEDPNEPALQDDPATFPQGRPNAELPATASSRHLEPISAGNATRTDVVEPDSIEVSPDLVDKVSKATYGKQTSVPFIPAPTSTISPDLVSANEYGFVDARIYGGTSFDLVGDGMHEPLNIIISSLSSPEILTRKGFQSYCRSLDFDRECLGLHAGSPQQAWTDPRGWRDQEFLYREVYTPLDHVFGTCIESLVGGNHIRAWQQQGSGAWFLATSKEENATKNHMIIPDGYNVGREELVQKALGSKKDGKTSFFFTKYQTEVIYVAGLMPPGIQGVNHSIPIDGLTAILTVKIIGKDQQAAAPTSNAESNQNAVPPPISDIHPHEDQSRSKTVQFEAKSTADGPISQLKRRFSAGKKPRSRNSVDLRNKSKEMWEKLISTRAPKHTVEVKSAAEPTSKAEESPSIDSGATTVAESLSSAQEAKVAQTSPITAQQTSTPTAAVAV